MFVFEEMKLHTNLGVGGDVWSREDFFAIKKRVQNRKGRKKKMPRVVKKGVEKKSLLNEKLRLVCLNAFLFSSKEAMEVLYASKSINDSATRIWEQLDKQHHMVARLESNRWFGSKTEEWRKLWKTTSLGNPKQMMR